MTRINANNHLWWTIQEYSKDHGWQDRSDAVFSNLEDATMMFDMMHKGDENYRVYEALHMKEQA